MLPITEQTLPLEGSYIKQLKKTKQNPRYHAEGSVYNHILLVLEQFERDSDHFDLNDNEREAMYWGAILHDIAKPVVTRWVNGRWSAKGHERAGVPIARDILLEKPEITPTQRKRIIDLVKWHSIPLRWGLRETDISHYKILATQTDLELLGRFCYFDLKGRICENKVEVMDLIGTFNEVIMPRIRYELGTYSDIQAIYQRAGFQKQNALWKAFKLNNIRLVEKLLAAKPASSRQPRCTCLITIGVPQSGKTEYLRNQYPDHQYFDLGQDGDLSEGHASWDSRMREVRHFISVYGQAKKNMVIDGTNLLEAPRRRLAEFARDAGVKVGCLFFDKSLNQILDGVSDPDQKDAITEAYQHLDLPHPWEANELKLVC